MTYGYLAVPSFRRAFGVRDFRSWYTRLVFLDIKVVVKHPVFIAGDSIEVFSLELVRELTAIGNTATC